MIAQRGRAAIALQLVQGLLLLDGMQDAPAVAVGVGRAVIVDPAVQVIGFAFEGGVGAVAGMSVKFEGGALGRNIADVAVDGSELATDAI